MEQTRKQRTQKPKAWLGLTAIKLELGNIEKRILIKPQPNLL